MALGTKGQTFNIKIPFVKLTVTKNGQVQTDISSKIFYSSTIDPKPVRLIDSYTNLSSPPTSDIIEDSPRIFVGSDYILVPDLKKTAAIYTKIVLQIMKKKVTFQFWYQSPNRKIKL